MQTDLFHPLKASNTPLVFFGRIISLVKRHESNIVATDTIGLIHRNKLI